jgi:NitT/TauT family transport system substrate-binding protein
MMPARFPSLLPLATAALLAGCGPKAPAPAAGAGAPPAKIIVQLDWVAEPEHGAFYTAEAMGFFRDEGLDVTLVQGGPNTYVLNKVAANQVQLGQSDSTTVLVAIHNGAPLLNVAAIFQHDPSVFMMQEANPVKTWADLQGRTVMARPEWAFLPYLQKKYHLAFKVLAQNFDFGRLAQDPNFIQQGYYIADPYSVVRRGVKLKYLYCWDTDFDAYTTLVTNRTFARDHGPELRAFLRALHRGWQYYLEKDAAPAHAIMLRINPKKVTADYLDWSRGQIISARLARNAEADYLTITPERYQRQISQLEDLGILPPQSLKVGDVMDASFLPKP